MKSFLQCYCLSKLIYLVKDYLFSYSYYLFYFYFLWNYNYYDNDLILVYNDRLDLVNELILY